MWSIIYFLLLGFVFPGHSVPLSPPNRVPDRKPSAPSLYILPPPAEQLNLQEVVTLTCLIEGFYPGDIFVKWLRNGQPVSESTYYVGPPNLQSNTPEQYFAYSKLTISKQEWNAAEIFFCQVAHKALPFHVIEKTVKKITEKPTTVDVPLR